VKLSVLSVGSVSFRQLGRQQQMPDAHKSWDW